MEISKVFAELGRSHLEALELREQLAETQAQLLKLKEALIPKPEAKPDENS